MAKRTPGHPSLPSYYAILAVDGDHMGRWLRGEFCRVEDRSTIQTTISTALTRFAVGEVPSIVRDHEGEVIYSGGTTCLLSCRPRGFSSAPGSFALHIGKTGPERT